MLQILLIGWTRSHFPFKYNLPAIYKQDYYTVKTAILNETTLGNISSNSNEASILDTTYKQIRKGTYTIKLQYILPGGKLGSNSTLNYKNPLN